MIALVVPLVLAFLAAAPFRPLAALVVALTLSAILPTVPDGSEDTLVFLVWSGVLLAAVLVGMGLRLLEGGGRVGRDAVSITGLMLAVFVTVNALVALAVGVRLLDWGRGLAPFLPLAYCLTVRRRAWPALARPLLLALGAVGAAFAFYGLVFFVASPVRLTSLDTRQLLPWSAVGAVVWAAVAFRSGERLRGAALGLALLCAVGVLLSMTRGLIAATTAGVAVVALHAAWRSGVRGAGLAALALAAVAGGVAAWVEIPALSIGGVPMGEYAWRRLTDTATIGERWAEIRAALEGWRQSPVLGQGLGIRYESTGVLGYRGAGVAYTHNAAAYFLMTGGVVGLLLYVGLYAAPLRRLFDARASVWQVAALGALVCLGLYSLTSGAFRLFQFNLILGITLMTATYGGEVEGAGEER